MFLFCVQILIPKVKDIKVKSKNIFTEHGVIRDVDYSSLDAVGLWFSTDYQNCPSCDIHNNHPENKTSTPRDCVLCVSVGKIDNIFPFVRSLRTTGCKATIVILFDDKASRMLSRDTIQLFANCSVEFFDIGHVEPWGVKNSIFAIKHLIAYDFIYKTASLFDRVLLIDLLDVVFQDDPFHEAVDPDALTIIKEARLFKDDPTNRDRIAPLIKYQKSMGTSQVLNGGMLYGSPEILMKYETIYFHQFNISDIDHTHKTCDQGYMNYFYVSGILNKEFEKLNLWHRDQGYDSLASQEKKDRPVGFDLGDIYYLHKRAIVIHMFDRSDKMIQMVLRACPQGNYYVKEKTYTRFRHNGLFGAY